MNSGLIASVPIPGIFLGTIVLIFIACEIGFQVGKRRAQKDKKAPDSIGSLVAGLLSMLAFVLALIFSSH